MTIVDWDFDKLDATDTHTAAENLANAEQTNALVEKILAESVGDAPKLEDQEDTRLTLPGGLYWEGDLIREAEVRELTGADEEELDRVQGNPARWLSVLLERAVVRLGDMAPTPTMIRKLLVGDRDALLLQTRIATYGRDLTYRNVSCPHCDENLDATVDLTTVTVQRIEDPRPRHEYTVDLRHGRSAVVRLPDGAAQESIFKNIDATLAQRNSALITSCLVSVDGQEATAGTARQLSMADRQKIVSYFSTAQPGPRLDQVTFEHLACGREVTLPITVGELFRGD